MPENRDQLIAYLATLLALVVIFVKTKITGKSGTQKVFAIAGAMIQEVQKSGFTGDIKS